MEKKTIEIKNILKKIISNSNSKHISFSGGLDSSIITSHLNEQQKNALVVITDDFIANDLTYSQIAAKHFQLKLDIFNVNSEKLLDAIEGTISILKNFNDIEIRNSVVMYLAFNELKNNDVHDVLTGDGADELFAGYNFLLNKSENELRDEITRIKKIMHFPSIKIAKFFGINIEQPFLDENVVDYAEKIPVSLKVNEKNGKKYGKWILRKAYENDMPKSIVWREKSPMQDGSGTSGLTKLFDSIIPDHVFNEKASEIMANDHVRIRTKESLHYYEIFRKKFGKPKSTNEISCPDCNNDLIKNTKFCQMCGKFPI